MKDFITFVYIVCVGWIAFCTFNHVFPDNEGMFNPDARLSTIRVIHKENVMKEAGKVNVGDTIVINGETHYVSSFRWHFQKGVEFFDNGKRVALVPFKEMVEVV